MAEEQITAEQMAEEQTAEKQAAEKQIAGEQITEGQMAKEQIAEEQITEEQTAKEQIIEEQMTEEQTAKEQIAEEQMTKEQTAGEVYGERFLSLAGIWKLGLGKRGETAADQIVRLPGSLDEQGKKIAGLEKSKTGEIMYLTPEYHYEGYAVYEREFFLDIKEGETVLFYMERTRAAKVWVNGRFIGQDNILTAPQEYDITEAVKQGENRITVEVENCFEQMPVHPILGSHMATAHTQTNWNGIVGKIGIRILSGISMKEVTVRTDFERKCLLVEAEVLQNTGILQSVSWEVSLAGGAKKEIRMVLQPGRTKNLLEYELGEDYDTWDEFSPSLHELTISLYSPYGCQETKLAFGIRKFQVSPDFRHFMINGKVIFIRSEANCAVFPRTGYAPMEEKEWEKLLSTYKSYGINYVRFHSWCPPEAAFSVADRLGIYLQPELCEWTFNTFESDSDYAYFTKEAMGIGKAYGNHPSYVALTWGNELKSHKRERMGELCRFMRQIDPDRLYAEGSNVWYGGEGINTDCDFVMAQSNYKDNWRGAFAGNRGFINECPPSTLSDYNEGLKDIPMPVISFEVGQFQVYPDYEEIHKYTGNLQPENLRSFKNSLEQHGLAGYDGKFQEVTGRLSQLCYREEIEAALRSDKLAGISLLGIQDFSGQGTALVGMLDAFGEPKKFSNPAAFKQFFNCVVPLLKIGKRTFTQKEIIQAEVLVANYGAGKLEQPVSICIEDTKGCILQKEIIAPCSVEQGKVKSIGNISFVPKGQDMSSYKLKIILALEGTEYVNEYEVWVYPERDKKEADSHSIVTMLNEGVRERLDKGENLIFLPNPTQAEIPQSIKSAFISDFWCWVMFRKWDQHGTMGMLIETEHKLFEKIQVDEYTNYPWWHMLSNSRSVILDGTGIQPVIRMVDNIHRNHSMGLLFEVKCGKGSLLISSLNILDKQEQPEAAWMLHCMLEYVKSGGQRQLKEVSFQMLCEMFPVHRELMLKDGCKPFAGINEEMAYAPLTPQNQKERGGYWSTDGSRHQDEKVYGILFEREQNIDMVQLDLVMDDGYEGRPGHDLPESLDIEYLLEDSWKPVHLIYKSSFTTGKENRIYFERVNTKGVRILLDKEEKEKNSEVYISTLDAYESKPHAIAEVKIYGA